jgi:hypothetical protein
MESVPDLSFCFATYTFKGLIDILSNTNVCDRILMIAEGQFSLNATDKYS